MGRKIDLTNKKFGRWTVLHEGYHIGLFETFEEAVYARQYLEKVLRGEFVKLNNFPNIILDTEKQKLIEEKIIKK